MPSFNLVTEKWVPCVVKGQCYECSLQEVLVRAHEITEIYDTSPLVTVSLHRLLLAILHRNFGPQNREEWQTLWVGGKWDESKLTDYLTKWRPRFDLFDDHYPFYQCSSIPFSELRDKRQKVYEIPIAKLFHELASGDNVTLFDHTTEAIPRHIGPAVAARVLVAFQAFALGGLITRQRGEGPSADNAPLVKGAVAQIRGNNLFQTLMLNFHHYSASDEEPFAFNADEDIPAWEKDSEMRAEDRRPSGYLDLLTWQSRRVRLHPEIENGEVVVKHVVVMKGNQFPDDFNLRAKETMLAFKKVERPRKGQAPWEPLSFSEERALWRDSLSLFQSVADERIRPKILDWVNDLASNDIIPPFATYNLSLTGLITNRAKITLWRHERLPLPLKYLEDENLIAALKQALDIAEEVGKELSHSTWYLARLLVAPEADRLNQQQKVDVQRLAEHLTPGCHYWAQLGISFTQLVTELAEDITVDGQTARYGDKTISWWVKEVRRAAENAFRSVADSQDRSARMLKAVSRADISFRAGVNRVLSKYENNEKKGGDNV